MALIPLGAPRTPVGLLALRGPKNSANELIQRVKCQRSSTCYKGQEISETICPKSHRFLKIISPLASKMDQIKNKIKALYHIY